MTTWGLCIANTLGRIGHTLLNEATHQTRWVSYNVQKTTNLDICHHETDDIIFIRLDSKPLRVT